MTESLRIPLYAAQVNGERNLFQRVFHVFFGFSGRFGAAGFTGWKFNQCCELARSFDVFERTIVFTGNPPEHGSPDVTLESNRVDGTVGDSPA